MKVRILRCQLGSRQDPRNSTYCRGYEIRARTDFQDSPPGDGADCLCNQGTIELCAGFWRSIFVRPICNLLDLSSTEASSWPFCEGVSVQRNVRLREPDVSSALVQTTHGVNDRVRPSTLLSNRGHSGQRSFFRPTSKLKGHLTFWSI